MTPVDAVLIATAGLAAGTINTVVGSGSLITFPALLALGYLPLVANVSNNIGLVGGGVTGVWGYRRELAGTSAILRRTLPWAAAGAVLGSTLLLVLPSTVFETVVVVLIALALVLILVQPAVSRRLRTRGPLGELTRVRAALLVTGLFLGSVYGGYFGAAQGVLYVAVLSLLLVDDLQVANGIKNVLALVVNGVSAVVFALFAQPDWAVVGLILGGSLLGGVVGSSIGRRLPPAVLRVVIVLVGVAAIANVLLR